MKAKPKSEKKREVVVINGRAGLRSMLLGGTAKITANLAQAQKLINEPAHYPVFVPPGEKGKWRIQQIEIEPQRAVHESMRHATDGFPVMTVSPGQYTTLSFLNKGKYEVMMSNTQFEYRTNVGFVQNARGHVLIAGLGLGMLLRPLASNPNVKSITVIELDQDVIDLVAPHYADLEQVAIIKSDIFRYMPARHYDWAMFDIWPNVSPDNLNQMYALRHRYRTHVSNSVCWAEDICREMGNRLGDLRRLAKKVKEHREQIKQHRS